MIVSASRWFVGSSRISRSGWFMRTLQSETRRFSPPESVFTSRSAGGVLSASMATSSFRSTSQASRASSSDWTFACSSMTSFISSGERSVPSFSLISSKRLRSACTWATPSSMFSRTVFVGSSWGSWPTIPIVRSRDGAQMPSNSLSSPARIFMSVDLPEPLTPITPIRSPG